MNLLLKLGLAGLGAYIGYSQGKHPSHAKIVYAIAGWYGAMAVANALAPTTLVLPAGTQTSA